MGYFSGPRTVSQWDATGGALGGLKSRVQGKATRDAEQYATRQALSQGGMNNFALGENIALADQAQQRRQAQRIENADKDLLSLGGGRYYGLYDVGNSAWDAFFESLRGKNVDWGGFGRTVDYDVPTGKSYNRDAGEIAPGRRGSIQSYAKENPQFAYNVTAGSGPDFRPSRGGFYTPEELGQMDPWQRARIGYENSLGRIQRGY